MFSSFLLVLVLLDNCQNVLFNHQNNVCPPILFIMLADFVAAQSNFKKSVFLNTYIDICVREYVFCNTKKFHTVYEWYCKRVHKKKKRICVHSA